MKNGLIKLISMAMVLILCLGVLTACPGPNNQSTEPGGDVPGGAVTDDTIWVGNTAGTTGALASIGAPFNLGIQAAFDAYNKAGGFNGKSIKLKHYDDGGLAENSSTLLEKLIHEDEVFAIVGHFGSYAVDVTLETLIDEEVPMIYAAAGNEELLNENAQSLGEKGIIPVQPLNKTEGRMLILRAFAPADKGGLGASKVGVIANSNEASQSLLAGIKDEMNNLPAAQKNNVVIQEVQTTDYSAAVAALKAAGCDTVVLTVIGADFLTALTTMANANFRCNVLTTYNNANSAVFNNNNALQDQYISIFETMNIFAQAWLDISSTDYIYKDVESPLYKEYKKAMLVYGKDENGEVYERGVTGFTEEYWVVANNIFNYAVSIGDPAAFAMSYDSYALAGYIAGDLFCQAMAALQESGKELSRANLIEVLESKEYKIAMADALSFANGMRSGVQSFALTWIFDSHNLPEGATEHHAAASATIHGLMSIEDYRALLQE